MEETPRAMLQPVPERELQFSRTAWPSSNSVPRAGSACPPHPFSLSSSSRKGNVPVTPEYPCYPRVKSRWEHPGLSRAAQRLFMMKEDYGDQVSLASAYWLHLFKSSLAHHVSNNCSSFDIPLQTETTSSETDLEERHRVL